MRIGWHGNSLLLPHASAYSSTLEAQESRLWMGQLGLASFLAHPNSCRCSLASTDLPPLPQQQTQLHLFSDPNFSFLTLTHTSQTWGKGLAIKSTACSSAWGEALPSTLPPEATHQEP